MNRSVLLNDLPHLLSTYVAKHHKRPEQISSSDDPAGSGVSREGKSASNEEIDVIQGTSTATHKGLRDDEPSLKEEINASNNEDMRKIADTDLHVEDVPGMESTSVRVRIHEYISKVKGIDQKADMYEDLRRGTQADPSHPSIEGFFLWLNEQSCEGISDRASQQDFLRQFLKRPIGSGIMGQPFERLMCCNQTADRMCLNEAVCKFHCDSCHLLIYCSDACRRSHENTHKQANCVTMRPREKTHWFPNVVKAPPLTTDDHGDADILNPVLPLYGLLEDLDFSENAHRSLMELSPPNHSHEDKGSSSIREDDPHERALPDSVHLLFPALYDLRNVFQTVRNLPDGYTGSITLLLNFPHTKLAVRDFLILELLRYYGAAGIDLAIGLWYSAAITATQDIHLMVTILRMLRSFASGKGNPLTPTRYVRQFSRSTTGSYLQADFGMDVWSKIIELVCNDQCNQRGFKPDTQYVWRYLIEGVGTEKLRSYLPAHLLGWRQYETKGLLLPFGASEKSFDTPNRLRYSPNSDHISRYVHDPTSGWDADDFVFTSLVKDIGAMDIYGMAFFQLRRLMEEFVYKISQCCVQVRLTHFRTRKLFQILGRSGMKFHRIDACTLDLDEELSRDEKMQYLGGVLARNASPTWPSLLLTATLGERILSAEVVRETLEKQKPIVTAFVKVFTTGGLRNDFWKGVNEVTMCHYIWPFLLMDLTAPSSDEEAQIRSNQDQVAATLGLYRQRRHLIVSSIPGVSLKKQRSEQDIIGRFVTKEFCRPYSNLALSGFHFRERFYEWGWSAPAD